MYSGVKKRLQIRTDPKNSRFDEERRKILDYETMLYESEEIMKFTHNSRNSSGSLRRRENSKRENDEWENCLQKFLNEKEFLRRY